MMVALAADQVEEPEVGAGILVEDEDGLLGAELDKLGQKPWLDKVARDHEGLDGSPGTLPEEGAGGAAEEKGAQQK